MIFLIGHSSKFEYFYRFSFNSILLILKKTIQKVTSLQLSNLLFYMYLHINFALSKRQLLSNAKILFNLNYRNYESIKINAGDKFAHVSVGNLQHFEGKQFVKEATEANSCEISFGSLPSGESVPFFHTHENNEENYIILSGSGKFQVNDSVFDISEGSVVRVSTHCDRCLKCTSDAPMLYLCIQAKENSLGGYTLDDAAITERVSLLQGC